MRLANPATLARRTGLRPFQVREVLLSGDVPTVIAGAVPYAVDSAFEAAVDRQPVSFAEAARMTGAQARTLRRLVAEGRLSCLRVPHARPRLWRHEVLALIAASEQPAGAGGADGR